MRVSKILKSTGVSAKTDHNHYVLFFVFFQRVKRDVSDKTARMRRLF